ncbi:MAG: PIN domain-containing protein [Chloroflexia bacterium]|nr:PIN domain-containing protein [Chloroflexia bacterium]
MRIYADTSIFGGLFDKEFAEPTRKLFDEIDQGHFTLVTSAVVEAEIEPAPETVRTLFARYAASAEITPVTEAALALQQQYISSGVVTAKSMDDALHVALATVSGCILIVSWNFKHIVHFDKIPKYNAVNTLNGQGQIGIYSPLEIIRYGNNDDT